MRSRNQASHTASPGINPSQRGSSLGGAGLYSNHGAGGNDDDDAYRRKAQNARNGSSSLGKGSSSSSGAGFSDANNNGGSGIVGIGKMEGRLVLGITALAAIIRLWKLGQPSSVV